MKIVKSCKEIDMYPMLYDEVRRRQEALLQEAEQERLLNTARSGSKIATHSYRLLAYRLGDQLEHWGCLLKRFGAVAHMSH